MISYVRCFEAKLLKPACCLMSNRLMSSVEDDSSPVPVDTRYPVIPKTKYLIPIPNRSLPADANELVESAKQWFLEIASRSSCDDKTKQVIESEVASGDVEAGLIYHLFPLSTINMLNQQQIVDMSKQMIFNVTFDNFMSEANSEPTIGQRVYDYALESMENPENWQHDTSQDHKRHFFLNLWGHAINDWRRSGMTVNQTVRMLKTNLHFIESTVRRMDKKKLVKKFTTGNYLKCREKDGSIEDCIITLERAVNIDLSIDVRRHPDIDTIVRISSGIVCLANDLASYFREKSFGENDLNYITVARNEFGLDEQRAVNKTCEYIVKLHEELGNRIDEVVDSQLCRRHPELELYCKYVIPKSTYSISQLFDYLGRNRVDGKRKVDWTDDSTRWDDEIYFNETDPMNRGVQFVWPIESFGHDHYKTIRPLM